VEEGIHTLVAVVEVEDHTLVAAVGEEADHRLEEGQLLVLLEVLLQPYFKEFM